MPRKDFPEDDDRNYKNNGSHDNLPSEMPAGAPPAQPTMRAASIRLVLISADGNPSMNTNRFKKDDPLMIVLSFAFIGGLLVALVLCGLWRYHPGTMSGQARVAAVAICPPFLLAQVLEATTDSTLALIMTMGTIVFANGFLYAGLASFIYFLTTLFLRRGR